MTLLRDFTDPADPVYKDPFTVIDGQQHRWTIVTDRVTLIACINGPNVPRFKGNFQSLNTVLRLLRLTPPEGTLFEVAESLRQLGEGQDPVDLLGICVSRGRLRNLFGFSNSDWVRVWDASTDLGVSGLGFRTPAWRAWLSGLKGVEEAKPLTSKTLFEKVMDLS